MAPARRTIAAMPIVPPDCVAVSRAHTTPPASALERILRMLSVATMLMTVPQVLTIWIGRDAGGNPFNELTLPDALIKFRQGVGRLIRNKTDRGLVTILDARVLAKTYGREFLGSLPTSDYERIDRDNRERAFRPFP